MTDDPLRAALERLASVPDEGPEYDLANRIHDAMPDKDDWQPYFRVIEEPDGWWLEIRRTLSERIAAALTARPAAAPALDEGPRYKVGDCVHGVTCRESMCPEYGRRARPAAAPAPDYV